MPSSRRQGSRGSGALAQRRVGPCARKETCQDPVEQTGQLVHSTGPTWHRTAPTLESTDACESCACGAQTRTGPKPAKRRGTQQGTVRSRVGTATRQGHVPMAPRAQQIQTMGKGRRERMGHAEGSAVIHCCPPHTSLSCQWPARPRQMEGRTGQIPPPV